MRIIKGGRKPPKEIEMECDRCGCVFAYEKRTYNTTNTKMTDMFYVQIVIKHLM